MSTKLVFVTYETPFAPAGGIAAVMGRLPDYIFKASGLETIVVTPYHHKIRATADLPTEEVGKILLDSPSGDLPIKLRLYEKDVLWYFLQPEQPDFFAGSPHPFRVGETQDEFARNLLRDSLLFGRATAKALEEIDPDAEWVLMMQDWEAATTALALSGTQHRMKLFLTLHNSYDSPVSDEELAQAGIQYGACPGTTVLNRAIPRVQRTIFTVSDQFALDLCDDEFQSKIMAPHLTDMLRQRLLGVNNGPFTNLAVHSDILRKSMTGHYSSISKWKIKNREKALEALKKFQSSPDKPLWGDPMKFKSDPSICWFVMAGRDDPRQKGYDIAAAAVETFLEENGRACFFFFPMPGDEGLDGLCFLKDLSERFPKNVAVLPFRWEEGYVATLRGASFGLMPSLYEPFGMANEFYLNGTIGIGRATGGIIQQIVPLRGVSCFSHAAEVRSAKWHGSSTNPTGLLFRETDNVQSSEWDWHGINRAAYKLGRESPNRLQERRGIAGDLDLPGYQLFRAVSDELRHSLNDAVRLFTQNSDLYYRMVTDGIDYVQRTFSWERAAGEYLRNALAR
jgi:glycogen synthase